MMINRKCMKLLKIEANTTKDLNIQYLYEFIGTHTKLQYPSRTLLNALSQERQEQMIGHSFCSFIHLETLYYIIQSENTHESDSTVKQRAMRVYLMISQIQQYLHYNLPERKPYQISWATSLESHLTAKYSCLYGPLNLCFFDAKDPPPSQTPFIDTYNLMQNENFKNIPRHFSEVLITNKNTLHHQTM